MKTQSQNDQKNLADQVPVQPKPSDAVAGQESGAGRGSVTTPKKSKVLAQLQVDRSKLVAGVQFLARLPKRFLKGDAILVFANGQLEISIGNSVSQVAATGCWPGEAQVSNIFVFALAKNAPAIDPIPFRVEAGRLHVASISFPCKWQ